MHAAGFVLVGGLSTRMGQDKALLSSGSHPLVTHVAQMVAEAAGKVALVGHPDRYRQLGFECLGDRQPNLGPLAGIEAALDSSRGDLNLIVACDMPGLNVSLLRNLLSRSAETQHLCVAARDAAGIVHPLCAVYRAACLPLVQRALEARRLKLLNIIEELSATYLDVDDVLWNVNTPEEWDAWRKQQLLTEGVPFASPHAD